MCNDLYKQIFEQFFWFVNQEYVGIINQITKFILYVKHHYFIYLGYNGSSDTEKTILE